MIVSDYALQLPEPTLSPQAIFDKRAG